jgi:hypothetical protein
MQERVAQEFVLVRSRFPSVQHGQALDWGLIPDYKLPHGRYNKSHTRILFRIPPGYPNTGPDNFFVDNDLRLTNGNQAPGFNSGSQSGSGAAPIGGDWGWFSWHPQSWRPAATISGGDNLLTFLVSVNICLQGQETS